MIVTQKKQIVTNPESAANVFHALLRALPEFDKDKEHFWVMGLNARGVTQYVDLCHVGTLSSCMVHPRDVFRMAIHRGVSCIIACHNHPGGSIAPSSFDMDMTRRLVKAGRIIGIPLNDHVIIAQTGTEQDQFSLATWNSQLWNEVDV